MVEGFSRAAVRRPDIMPGSRRGLVFASEQIARSPAPRLHARMLRRPKEPAVGLGTILLIVLILMLIGVFPAWPHSRGWGYGPSGGLGLVVIILIVLLLMGRL